MNKFDCVEQAFKGIELLIVESLKATILGTNSGHVEFKLGLGVTWNDGYLRIARTLRDDETGFTIRGRTYRWES
jgi:hypothetical protein